MLKTHFCQISNPSNLSSCRCYVRNQIYFPLGLIFRRFSFIPANDFSCFCHQYSKFSGSVRVDCCFTLMFITRSRKAPESTFRHGFLFLFLVFWISYAVTKPKLRLSLDTKKKSLLHHSHRFSLHSRGVGSYWSGKVGYWCFLAFFLFILCSDPCGPPYYTALLT